MAAQTLRAKAMRAKKIKDELRHLQFGMNTSYEVTHALESESPQDRAEWEQAREAIQTAQRELRALTDKWNARYTERDREYLASLRKE